MKRIGHFAVGIADGSVEMFSAFESGGPMWTEQGPRLEVQHVRFDEKFSEVPAVHVGLAMWDIERSANQRADIRAAHITVEGFELQFRTWGDTRVARVRANWMAVGAVRHIEDWDQD